MRGGSGPTWPLRLLTGLYPRRLRREYGAEMVDFLAVRLERERGRRARVRIVGAALRDVVRTWWAERGRREPWSAPRRRERRMDAVVQDLRYALRRLVRTPAFSLGALAIVAIAIGANAAVFAVVDEMVFAPLPYGEPDRVVHIYQDSDDGQPSSSSFPAYRDMAALTGVFESVAATSPGNAALEADASRVPVSIEYTTSSYLETIGRAPVRGRWFDASMDRVGAGNYAVVSHHAWQVRFGGDPSIVGRTIRLNRQPVTVIGVGPEGYNGVGGFVVTDFWLSISSTGVSGDFRVANLERRTDHWYDVRARLAPGVTVAQAQQAMNALAQRLAEAYPELNEGRGITVFRAGDIRIHPEVDATLYSAAGVLMAVVFLVLVLASSNVGSLLLVRGMMRRPELAVRRVLGAGSARVARLFLIEALLLSTAGGLLGLLLARWSLAALPLIPLPDPLAGTLDVTLDARVLLFSLGLMTAAGLFFGWAPALQSLKTDLSSALREDRHTTGGGRRMSIIRNVLVAVQVAVSLILVVAAGVMVRNLARSQRVDTGVDVEQLAYLRTTFSEAGIAPDAIAPVLSELETRLATIPGVTSVAVTSRLPVQRGGTTTTVVEGYEPASGTGSVELPWTRVSPDYFSTLGIRVLHGRAYNRADIASNERLVIVNETAARRFWGTPDAVGRRIRPQGSPDAWIRVAGVVEDTRVASLREAPTPLLYYLMGQNGVNSPYLLVRSTTDPAAILPDLRSELVAVNPQLPEDALGTLESHLGATLASTRVSTGAISLFSFLALLLASVGIYTIVSFSVAARMPEIGLRVALGAARLRVIRTVVGDVALTVGLGLLTGAIIVLAVGYSIGPALFSADLLEPGTLVLALLILAAAVGIASYLPARRAATADPVQALRGP